MVIIAFDKVSHSPPLASVLSQVIKGNQPPWPIINALTRAAVTFHISVENETYPYNGYEDTTLQRLDVLGPSKTFDECEGMCRLFWSIFFLDKFCSTVTGWDFSLASAAVMRRLPHDETHWNDKIYRSMPPPYFRVTDAGIRGPSSKLEIGHHASVGSFAYGIEATQNLS
jgi:hypothetical protein